MAGDPPQSSPPSSELVHSPDPPHPQPDQPQTSSPLDPTHQEISTSISTSKDPASNPNISLPSTTTTSTLDQKITTANTDHRNPSNTSPSNIDSIKSKLFQATHSSPSSSSRSSSSSSSPTRSIRSFASHKPLPPSPAKLTNTLPPPILIPHLLLDRSRLKPVPKPQPAPLQAPATFSHLIPVRAKLRSISNPNATTTATDTTPSKTSDSTTVTTSSNSLTSLRSVSDSLVGANKLVSRSAHNQETTPDPPSSEVLAPPLTATSTDGSQVDSNPTAKPVDFSTPVILESNNRTATPTKPVEMIESHHPTIISPPPADNDDTDSDPNSVSTDHIKSSASSEPTIQSSSIQTMALTTNTVLPSSVKSSSPPQSKSTRHDQPSPSAPAHESQSHTGTSLPQSQLDHHSQDAHNQDEIQSWQARYNATDTFPSLDHSTLERANSAAARLDSLARLNGVKTSSPIDSSRHHPTHDLLPPFLMAKHIEETKRKVELGHLPIDQTSAPSSFPLAPYPLPLPVSLGFGVGPNGRGVPRLSALQRKALEKMTATHENIQDVSTATTSLSRSHTTTGTESRKHLLFNRIQSPTSDESDERQQARSNLIRKLSSRGPNPRLKLPTPSSPPTNLPFNLDDTLNHHPLGSTCEDDLTPSSHSSPHLELNQLTLRDSSQLPESTVSLSQVPNPPTDTNSNDRFQSTRISNTELESIVQSANHSDQTCASIRSLNNLANTESKTTVSTGTFQPPPPPPPTLRNSLDSQHSHTDPKHMTVTTPNDTHTGAPDVSDSPVLRLQKSTSHHSAKAPTDCSAGVSTSNSAASEDSTGLSPNTSPCQTPHVSGSGGTVISEPSTNPQSSINSQDHLTMPGGGPAITPISTSSGSIRSSIVLRLKDRNSLSSRIDRSLASGRSPSPSQTQSRQSSIDDGNDRNGSRRRSAINVNTRASRPVNPSHLQRTRTMNNETSQDRTSKSSIGFSRGGSTSPSHTKSGLLHNGDRPMRPICPPPITQAHSIVGRGILPHKPPAEVGPSQFPPPLHLVRTHMPVASAADLVRYNDQKLAPFPALLNSSPPSSPERPKSPRSKASKQTNYGILSKSSSFFRAPSRRSQDGIVSNGVNSLQIGLPKPLDPVLPSNYPMRMCKSSDDAEEVVDANRWQSIGDVAEKISASAELSRSPTAGSTTSSVMSMVSNQRREQILARLSPFLKPSNATTSENIKLNDPPRKLLWHQTVLQVVNATSVKDRYLFLFNDLLVITKPIIEFEDQDGDRVPKLPITLKHSFLSKSVVEIQSLGCTASKLPVRPCHLQDTCVDQSKAGTGDVLHSRFKEMFENHPSRAVQDYLSCVDTDDVESEVAKLLLTITGLDKRQLGQYLCGSTQVEVLKRYLDQLNFGSMRIEDALRLTLLSLRLPADPQAIVRFLDGFGTSWATSNPKVGISAKLVTRWATEMIVLSEHLHDGLTDSMRYVAGLIGFPNGVKTEVDFVKLIKAEFATQHQSSPMVDGKPSNTLPADKLEAMLKKSYQSIRRDRLIQARANAEDVEKIELVVQEGEAKGLKLPPHVIYQTLSDIVTVSIPQPDAHFGIKLFGSGLSFEPSFLSFSHSSTASFQIKGKSLGMRLVSFIKIGRRAAAYGGLPLNATVSVERAFMRHTVQVSFLNQAQAKRNYLFSFQAAEPKMEFLNLVSRAQNDASSKQCMSDNSHGPQALGKIAALHVLRDTLVLNEDLMTMNVNPYASTTVGLKVGNRSNKSPMGKNPNGVGKLEVKKPTRIRSNSLSETYIHTMGGTEKELHQAIIARMNQAQEVHVRRRQQKLLQEQLRTNLEGGKMALNPYSCSNKENPVGNADEKANLHLISKYVKSGDELIKHCEQNSLIPLVLGFLSMGLEKVQTSNTGESSPDNYNSPSNGLSLGGNGGGYSLHGHSINGVNHHGINGFKKQITHHSHYHYLQHHQQQQL